MSSSCQAESQLEPLCPRAVEDVQAWILYSKPGGDLYCVGSLEQDRFISVPEGKLPLVLDVIHLFDGAHSLEWIKAYCRRELGQDIDAMHLYQLLSNADLIASPTPQHVFKGEFRRYSIDLVDLPTRRFFEWLQPIARCLLSPLLLLSILVILGGMLTFNTSFLAAEKVYQIQGSFLAGYLVLMLAGLASLAIHELAHAFVGAACGVATRHIKLALYMGFVPYLYTEVAGLYTLPPGKRIRVWAAGCYVNLCLGCIGLIVYRLAGPSLPLVVTQVIHKMTLANFLMIAGNLSPLMPTDGYFIISTLIKRVNIRTNAFDEFLKWLRGKENRLRGGLLVYFLATLAILAGTLIFQIRWFIGILEELVMSRYDMQIFQGYLLLLFAILLLLRLIGARVIKLRQRKASVSLNK